MIANVPDACDDVSNVAYSADRCPLAAGCEDGSIWFWEAHSGKVARE